MDWYTIFLWVIRICLILLMISASRLLNNTCNYLFRAAQAKREEEHRLAAETKDINDRLEHDLHDIDINSAVNILDLCKVLIKLEISNILELNRKLGVKYEYIKIDEDSKKIAENVYNALDKSVLEKNNAIITTDYIMKFISTESIITLMDDAQQYNSTLTLM